MDTIADIPGAKRALRQYLVYADGKLPQDTYQRLEDLVDSPSPVDAMARSAELLYARRDELDDEGRALVAGLSAFCALNGFHSMADDNRGGLMAQAMQREMGAEQQPGQPPLVEAKEDPKPLTEFVPPPEPTPEPADPAAEPPAAADDAKG